MKILKFGLSLEPNFAQFEYTLFIWVQLTVDVYWAWKNVLTLSRNRITFLEQTESLNSNLSEFVYLLSHQILF